MKFLMFNIVVAGALAYLFVGERLDVRSVADRAVHAATDIKEKAQALVKGDSPKSSRPTPPPKVVTKAPPPPKKRIEATAPMAPVPVRQEPQKAKAEKSGASPLADLPTTAVSSVPARPPQTVKRRATVVKKTARDTGKSAVARRRAIVLDGKSKKSVPAEAERPTSAVESIRRLTILSQEMELFSAKAIGQ